jgi:prepilin-type N-terminal cleavage/methylation domain-containing protein
MSKETRNCKLQQSHKKLGKRGYSLVELCIVLALIAVVATAVVSFYRLMSGTLNDTRVAYAYLEDHDALKKKFDEWAAEMDVPGSVFFVSKDGELCINENCNVKFSNGTLFFEGYNYETGFDHISGMTFKVDEEKKLIKCVTYYEYNGGDRVESHFVFSPRCGTIEGE